MFAYSFTPPVSVCDSGTVTLRVLGEEYGFTGVCGPLLVNSEYTYSLSAAANVSIGFYLIEGGQLFLDSTGGHMTQNVSYAQAFIISHPQMIGFQV